MISFIDRRWGVLVSAFGVVAVVALGLLFVSSVIAAPPYAVTYRGTPVTIAVPGKPVTINFEVENTGTTVYSGVKVIFHIPEGLTHTKVMPANAAIVDDTITWINVPVAAGKSFYPSLTVTMDSGTPLKTKKSIWVEVTGTDMEANSQNFSLTAVSASVAKTTTVTTTTLSSADVSSLFQLAYGRGATTSELTYWLGRRVDKSARDSLFGAMQYHKLLNISH